jgi:hypothetical protein
VRDTLEKVYRLVEILRYINSNPYMMNLSDSEKLFMDEFREKKYHPEYLFEDSGIVDRLSRHPMAMWKMQNTDKRVGGNANDN